MKTIDYESLLSQDAFKKLDPAKKEMFMQLAEKLKGKSASESLPLLMGVMKNLPSGPELSKDEKNAVVDAIVSSLPENEAENFNKLMKLMNM